MSRNTKIMTIAMLAGVSAMAVAQGAFAQAAAPAQVAAVEQVVVTGSRLATAGFTAPTPVSVTVAPASVAGPETIVNDGGNSLEDEAVSAKAASPNVLLAKGAKVSVWIAGPALKERSTAIAAE